jgi:uncharacterized protein YbdZ (MbtH family)
MYRGSYQWFKVVHRNKNEFAVWHADAEVLTGWQETGSYGTVDDCFDYIDNEKGSEGYLFRFDDL